MEPDEVSIPIRVLPAFKCTRCGTVLRAEGREHRKLTLVCEGCFREIKLAVSRLQ